MKFLIIMILITIFHEVKATNFQKIYGCFWEGGIITGKISENSALRIDDQKILTYNNRFIFAFGRKFKENIKIEVDNISKEFNVKNKEYKIENIRGLPQNKVEPSKKELDKIISDQQKIKEAKNVGIRKKLFNKRFILPSKGRLSGVYGSQRILNSKPRRPHAGIDIAAKEGTNVIAPSSGVIKLVQRDMFFTGNTIIIDHGLGLISIFAHLKAIWVNERDEVFQGKSIGSIVMTGRATGPHLHWGVYLNKTSVDPMTLINFELN